MKNNGKYYLRFAGVCAALGLVLATVGVAIGGETEQSFNLGDTAITVRPWGVQFSNRYHDNNYFGDKYDRYDHDDLYDDDLYDDDLYDDDLYDDDDDDRPIKANYSVNKKLEAFSTIDIKTVSEDIAIEYGDDYNIKMIDENDVLRYSLEGGKLKVWREKSISFSILNFDTKAGAVIITIPKGVVIQNAEVNTVSADAYVNIDIDTVTSKTTSGDLEFNGKYKQLRGKSVSGEVTANGSADDIVASTTSGDIEINASVGNMELGTVSGEISMDIMGARSNYTVKASTTSGEIEIDNDVFRKKATVGSGNYSVDLSTVSGDIDIEFLQ